MINLFSLRKFLIAGALIAAPLSGGSAWAVQIVNFPNVMTSNLVFSSLEESNNSIISGQTLFGGVTGSAVDDDLTLQSTAFTVSSVGGIEYLLGNFDATITAKPGHLIKSVSVKENGSAMTFGAGSLSFVNFEASVAIGGGNVLMDDVSFTKTGVAGPPHATTWMRSLGFSFSPRGSVLLSVRNELFANGSSGVASIGKDKVIISVETVATSVPEPTSGIALAVFCVGAAAVRRRRRR